MSDANGRINLTDVTRAADRLFDVEKIRIQTENQLRALTQPVYIPSTGHTIDKHGENTRTGELLRQQLTAMEKIEKAEIRELEDAVLATPFGPWITEVHGLGLKSVGLLLGLIGDPAHRLDPDTGEIVPRTLGQLNSFCGVGNAERQRRRKGMSVEEAKACGSKWAKTILIGRIAEAAFKQPKGVYRSVYVEAKARYGADPPLHRWRCTNTVRPVAGAPKGSNGCGTQREPQRGEIGSPWQKGHMHGSAKRLVGKAFLADFHSFAQEIV